MTDIELLPLPSVLLNWPHPTNHVAIRDYARANVAHATAAKDAEIEALRGLLIEACDDGDEADADLLATLERARTAEARAERLAEALRGLCNVIDGHEVHVAVEGKAAHARDALRDHDQEEGSGAFWGSSPKSGGPDWTGFDG